AALLAAVLAGTATAAPARAAAPWTADTVRLSTGPAGVQPDGDSWPDSLSANGRYAVFGSSATNIVAGDTNGQSDVFVRDLVTGRAERVSLTAAGTEADGSAMDGSISGDGRYVVFASTAALVPGDTNGAEDVYVRDRFAGRTERLSAGDPAREQPGLNSYLPTISSDGRYVAFASSRTDLVPGGTPALANVYVADRRTGAVRLITVGADGSPADRPSAAPVLSADGSTVGFISKATNLLPPGEGGPVDPDADRANAPVVAADRADDHVPGRPAHAPERAPRRARADGRASGAGTEILKPRLYPFYVHTLATGKTVGGSLDENGELSGSSTGALSPDGRFAAYSQLVPNRPGDSGFDRHYEIRVRDLRTGTVRQIPPGLPGTTTLDDSFGAVIASGNRWVYFTSYADNLVAGDTNGGEDVFRHDLWTGRTERVSVSSDGAQNPGLSSGPVVGALGTTVLFASTDGTLVPGDTNAFGDAFARRLPPS
ncbi:hypothetical protein, partial [Kitasatospora sp. NPDC002965]|uniref:hypothetical protein n=1 Tax=Kitasatospora sp. NPDC002965 TaxID=3154775 RepID=UPI0033A143FD